MTNSTVRTIVIVVLIGFGILTGIALAVDGVFGIFQSIISSWGSTQIYVDLVIAVAFVCVWIYKDAKAHGKSPWPWIITALIVGMFSPLVYVLVRDNKKVPLFD